MEFQREFIEIGQIQIRYYGIIIVTAMLVATAVAANLARRTGRDSEHIYGALTWAIIPGIILARLWFVLFPPALQVAQGLDRNYYLNNFFDLNNGAIAIWSGGLSIFGALLGGFIGVYIYLRRNKLPFGPWLDIAAVVLPLGQAIGRWANFINRELYGTPTTLPWGLDIPRDIRPEEYRTLEYFDAKFHPLFLYESLWSLLAFIVLYRLYTKSRDRFKAGDFILIYIAQYAFIRFFLEFIRVEVTLVGDINLSQLVTAGMFVVAMVLLLVSRRSGIPAEGYPAPLPQEMPPDPNAKTAPEKKPARTTRAKATAAASASDSAMTYNTFTESGDTRRSTREESSGESMMETSSDNDSSGGGSSDSDSGDSGSGDSSD